MAQIKKDTSLRKAILQAAITGQLVSNVEGESLPLASASKLSSATPSAGASPATPPETGKELLDKIIEERNKKLLVEWEEALKKNPKAKKPAPVVASEIDEEEIPFEIPENWCWCRLGDLITFVGGYAFKSTDFNEVTNNQVIRLGNVKENSLILDQKQVFVSDLVAQQASSYQIKESDILVTMTGTRGKGDYFFTVHITDSVLNGKKIFINQRVGCLRTNSLISSKWLCFTLQSNFIREAIFEHETGTANQGNIGSEDIKKILLPLPPLAVQNAIVAKLEQVLPLVDAYENAILQKEELKSALPDKVKKAILQEAIIGQLTEAWRKSATIKESGKQLLDRIIEERNAKALAEWEEALKKNPKAKKPVPVVASEIEEEDIPFEVPENWCWCRLGDLGDFVRGSGIKRDETRPEGFPCIRYGEMYTRYKTVINETVSFVDKDVFDSCQKIIKNDIAMALTGENEYDIALAAVYTGDKEVAMGGDMTRLRPTFVNPLYLVFTLNSPYGIQCKSELATGNIIVHISNDKLGSIMIPLPPLEEQEEIVKKVEELLPLCK